SQFFAAYILSFFSLIFNFTASNSSSITTCRYLIHITKLTGFSAAIATTKRHNCVVGYTRLQHGQRTAQM
uniref:Secreted protein n=1 Tax=Oryza brachyantha TaxID=4533 RepID=J3N5R7_ORYBR